MEENFSPVSPEMYEEKQTEEKPIKTAADRLRETVNMPDFGIPEIQTNDEIFKEAPTPLPLDIAHKLVDGAKIREGVGEQTAVAIENALTGIGAFGDQATLAFGQITSAVTGNTIAEDFMDTAVKNLEMRMEDMKYAEDSVGGVRNLIAQLAGGAVSMGELLLVSAATGGMGGYVQMGVQAFGEGAFNDMEKYKEEHGGSLKGYQPKNLDIAINAGNAFLQAVIEKKFGVSSPRFLTGLSRGLVAEGASGFLQESTQSALADLAEYAKGNKEVEGWLDDAEGWIRDGIVGAILQGSLGAATYNYAHNNAVKFYAKARAQAQGRETPNNEDTTFGKNIVNAKERGYASALTQEFKAAFDASTGEGQLQAKIASALKKAAETKELDLDTANETEMAQRIEQIATQETLNAMDFAREQNRAISDMELNNIVYKDGAIWLEGLTPEVGDKAVSYARVLAERQSGLAELKTRIDANAREIQQLKADLAEAKAQKQESRAQVLQARIDKQNALAEKNRLQAQKLEAQTAKLEKQIAKQTEQVKVAEPVKTEKVSAEEVKPVETPAVEKPAVAEPVKMAEVKTKKTKPVAERKSLKQERVAKAKTKSKKKPMTLKELKEKLTEHFKQVYQGASDWLIQKYVDEAIEDVELTRNKNVMLRLLAENFDQYYKDGKVDTEEILYDGDIKGETVFAQYMMETDDLAAADDSDSDAMEVVDTFLDAVHDVPITTKEQATEWVKNHQYESTVKKLGLDENAVDNDVFEFDGSEYDLSGVTKKDLGKAEQRKLDEYISKKEAEKPTGDMESLAGKTNIQIADEQIKKAIEPVAERKFLKEERVSAKEYTKKVKQAQEKIIKNITEGSDRFIKILIPKEKGSFIEANKETLDKIDVFTKADFFQRALSNDKITPSMIDEIFEAVSAMPQYESLSNVYYDIAANPKTNPETVLKAKEKYSNIFTPRSEKPMENWAGKTREEVADAVLQKALQPALSIINTIKNKDNMITDDQIEKREKQINNDASTIDWKRVVDGILMKYELDPRVVKYARENPEMFNDLNYDDYWLRDQNNTGNTFIDVFGEYVDRIPDDYVDFDELDDMLELAGKSEEEKIKYFEEHNGYEESVYLLPKDQKQAESKIIQTMAEQTELALIKSDELEINDPTSADLYDAKITTDKTPYLFQGSVTGKGDTNRGGYDDALKRIILDEKSDLSTIQHEFAHYWIQNNFKWARSGLASQDWLRRWRDVEEWLGIEPQDRLLSKSASEKFAKAYERYILEGKVAPELQWAFEGFQKAYQDIYDDLEKEYFDLEEELSPEVIDWFNRNKEQSPKRLLEADTKKIEKQIALSAGTSVIEDVAGTVVMTEPEANGDQKVYMGVKQSEVPAGDNLLVQADKTTASKLQQSAKRWLSDKVEVQQLTTLDTQATLQNFKDWIARDRAGAWDAMMNPDTRPIYRTYLYKAFAEEAFNDVDLAIELANVNMAESVREMGQAIQALDIRNISGFDTIEIIRNIEKSKGTISSEELNKEVESIGLDMVELSQDEIDEVDFDTECKL